MDKASKICGIIAVASLVTFLVYPAVILGALSILFALLSRGEETRLSDKAKTGLTTGIIAISVNLVILGFGCLLIFSSGPYKDEMNKVCKQMYGQTFDDMMEDAMDGSFDLEYHNLPMIQ